MNWEQQLEQIERQVTDRAREDAAFAELVRTDLREAVRQATGLDIPFDQLEAMANPSGELSEEDLEQVAGGMQVSPIDLSGMDIETALLAIQSQRVQMMDQMLFQMATTGSSEMDMLRLQSLMNKRNEAFEAMTNVLNKFHDMKNSIIGNM